VKQESYDAEVVRTKTLEHIATNRAKAVIHTKVCEALKTWQGKPINKRIQTLVQKALGEEYTVYWSTSYGWLALDIWSATKLPYNNKYNVMLAYDNDTYPTNDRKFDFAHWEVRYSNSHGNNRYGEWADKSEHALRFLDQRIQAYNEAMAAAKAAYEALEGLAVWT
jgi:hypothetical protein